MRFLVAVPLALSALAAALPVSAQTYTDDELLKLFRNQRDAYHAVKTGSGLTRGLTLLTLGVDAPQTDAPTLNAPGTEDTVTALSGADASVDGLANPENLPQPDADKIAAADTTTAALVDTIGVFPEPLQINVKIRFDFDSAKLNASQKPQLAQLCTVMGASDIKLFQIIGHTDASGTAEYNERLSQLRAEEVKRFFVSDCGIDTVRLQAVGMGERILRDKDDPKSGENRRVEFQALS